MQINHLRRLVSNSGGLIDSDSSQLEPLAKSMPNPTT